MGLAGLNVIFFWVLTQRQISNSRGYMIVLELGTCEPLNTWLGSLHFINCEDYTTTSCVQNPTYLFMQSIWKQQIDNPIIHGPFLTHHNKNMRNKTKSYQWIIHLVLWQVSDWFCRTYFGFRSRLINANVQKEPPKLRW